MPSPDSHHENYPRAGIPRTRQNQHSLLLLVKRLTPIALKTCFVISPIGDEDSDVRRRSDQIWSFVIEPAVKPRGYRAVRADRISNPGLITPVVIDHLYRDELVIADLTFKNANVFYELAIRHAAHKPVINIKDEKELLPFDIAGMRTIDVDFRFVKSMEKCRDLISQSIQEIEKNPKAIFTPITFTSTLLSNNKNGEAQSRVNMQIMSELQTIKADISDLKPKVDQANLLNIASRVQAPLDLDLRNLNLHILGDSLEFGKSKTREKNSNPRNAARASRTNRVNRPG